MLAENLDHINQARTEALCERDAAREAQALTEAQQALQQQNLDMLTDRLIDVTKLSKQTAPPRLHANKLRPYASNWSSHAWSSKL